jgi:hypothetical protein
MRTTTRSGRRGPGSSRWGCRTGSRARASGMRRRGRSRRRIGPGRRRCCGWRMERARPALEEVVAVAHERGVPVIVDAAAELPPRGESAAVHRAGRGSRGVLGRQGLGRAAGFGDLGRAAGSGDVGGACRCWIWTWRSRCSSRRPSFIDRALLPGLPRNGVGRPCKAGKEEIAGLLVALERFVAEGTRPGPSGGRAAAGDRGRVAGLAAPASSRAWCRACAWRWGRWSGRRRSSGRSGAAAAGVPGPGELELGRIWVSPLCLRPGTPG